tara:strand:- start:2316 stop:2624 length:309 start_codon:yes stop_codon:yes gene_type:complete
LKIIKNKAIRIDDIIERDITLWASILFAEEYIGIIAAKLPKLNTSEKSFAVAKTKKYMPTFFGSSSLTRMAITPMLQSIPIPLTKLSFIEDFKLKIEKIDLV